MTTNEFKELIETNTKGFILKDIFCNTPFSHDKSWDILMQENNPADFQICEEYEKYKIPELRNLMESRFIDLMKLSDNIVQITKEYYGV